MINFVMRDFIFISSIVFLSMGNMLFPTIHYFTEHTHSDDIIECIECEFYECNSNIFCENKLNFFNRTTTLFLPDDLDFVESKIYQYSHSRAPPLS